MNALRQITADEVTFQVFWEVDEYENIEGNARAIELDVISRLEAGDDSAWCIVVVTCIWQSELLGRELQAESSIGSVTLTDTYTIDRVVEEHDMRAEALRHLNDNLAGMVQDGIKLSRELGESQQQRCWPGNVLGFPGTLDEEG